MNGGYAVVAGTAQGPLVRLDEPLSFWGGFDPETGEIIDVHHPQRGLDLRGAVVAMPAGRGSSSASSVILEAIRAGAAPAALLLTEPDEIIALGAIVGHELYDVSLPILVGVDDVGFASGAIVMVTSEPPAVRLAE